MKLLIEHLNGSKKGEKQEFSKVTINIGSDSSNDIILEDLDNTSPNHAMVFLDKDKYIIFNHSEKGTYIDDCPIIKAEITEKSIIKFGINGPSFLFEVIKDNNELPKVTIPEDCKRWYDRNTLISKSIDLLKNTNNQKASIIATKLLEVLNKQDPESLYIRSDIKIDDEIKSLPRQSRWYDYNKIIQKIIESLKLCKPEMQEYLVTQMIIMIDTSGSTIEKENKDKIENNSEPEEIQRIANLINNDNDNLQKNKEVSSNKESINNTFNCLNCKEININGAKFCISCGYKFVNQILTCPKCSFDNKESSKFCLGCGNNLFEQFISCPECRFDNKKSAKFCLGCGYKFVNENLTCPECGFDNKESAKFCLGCGCSFEEEEILQDNYSNNAYGKFDLCKNNSDDKSETLNLTLTVVIVILVVLAMIYIIILLFPKSKINNVTYHLKHSTGTVDKHFKSPINNKSNHLTKYDNIQSNNIKVASDGDSYSKITTNETPKSQDNSDLISILNQLENKYIDSRSLKGLSPWKLKVLRNGLYAKYGKPFKSKDLQCFFNNKNWYSVDNDFSELSLNNVEKANIQKILNYEKQIGSGIIDKDLGCGYSGTGTEYNISNQSISKTTSRNTLVINRSDEYAKSNPEMCRVYLRPTYESHFLSEDQLKAQYGNVDYVYCGTKAQVLEYNEPTYKIKTADGKVGWIYAGTVTQKNLPKKFDTTICRLNKSVKMILPNSKEGQMLKGSSFVVISKNNANNVYNIIHSNGTFASVKMSDCNIE